jgi:MFS family permease
MPSGRQWTLVATIVGSSLTFVDATVVNVALPALQADLNASITDVQWVIEAYALFLGALILVGGSMGDQFGRKRIFLAGVVVFTIASVGCGLAGSTGSLIVARAVQGVGAAFLVPGSLAIISATFDDVDRGRAIGTWSGFSAITSAIGPVAGGWLIEHAGWRSVFFLNVPLAAIVIMLSARFMTESRDTTRTSHDDWAGAGLAVMFSLSSCGRNPAPVARSSTRRCFAASRRSRLSSSSSVGWLGQCCLSVCSGHGRSRWPIS